MQLSAAATTGVGLLNAEVGNGDGARGVGDAARGVGDTARGVGDGARGVGDVLDGLPEAGGRNATAPADDEGVAEVCGAWPQAASTKTTATYQGFTFIEVPCP